MTLIDSSVTEALKIHFSKNKEMAKRSSDWERIFQLRMNEIVDKFLQDISQLFTSSHLQVSFCVKASPLMLRAFRVNLLQRYHIFSGAFSKDYKEEVQVKGQYRVEAKQILHKHTCSSQIYSISNLMGFPDEVGQEVNCYDLTLNSLMQGQAACFRLREGWGGVPIGTILHEVEAYVDVLGNEDGFIKKYSAFFYFWVQHQIQYVAEQIVKVYKEANEPQRFLHFSATELEISLLGEQIYQKHGYNMIVLIQDEEEMENNQPVHNLTKLLGHLHPDRSSNCYRVQFHCGEEISLGSRLLVEQTPHMETGQPLRMIAHGI